MHSALLIYEILDHIIDHLAQDIFNDTQKAGQRALAALARTCRVFSDPALNALWRRLDSLKPFVLCLPAKGSYINGRTPAFDDEEWSIVSRYAPRVQELILDDDISVTVLQSLWFRTTLLLPNLKRLEWTYANSSDLFPSWKEITLIRLLLSPSLVHLHAWLDDGGHPSVMAFLECYHILCPNLESLGLHFSHRGRSPRVTTAASRAISRTQNLKALSCGALVEATLIRITGSRQLESLEADFRDYQPDDPRKFAVHGNPPFENVRVLKLHFQDLSSIIPYLRSHDQPFEYIRFNLDTAPTPEVLREFFTALGSPMRQRTLQQIHLGMMSDKKEGASPLQAIDFQVLNPLTSFNLLALSMELSNPITLTDDELVRLVQAWPDLVMFYLNRYGWGYHSTSNIPTLKGLLLVIERCQKLRSLGLCVDARHIPLLSDAESSICNRAITSLWLTDSPIQESAVESVAQFLLHHLPVLSEIFAHYQTMWESVKRLIRQSR